MRYGSKIKGFNLFGDCQFSMEKAKEQKYLKEEKIKFSILFYLLLISLTSFLFTGSVHAQGFAVQPAIISYDTHARTNTPWVLKLHNFNVDEAITLNLKVIELTQDPSGSWLPLSTDPCDVYDYHPEMDISSLSSCQSWVTIDTNSVVVPKNGDVNVGVTIKTPSRVKPGFYGATIIASTWIQEGETAMVGKTHQDRHSCAPQYQYTCFETRSGNYRCRS